MKHLLHKQQEEEARKAKYKREVEQMERVKESKSASASPVVSEIENLDMFVNQASQVEGLVEDVTSLRDELAQMKQILSEFATSTKQRLDEVARAQQYVSEDT